MKRSDTSVLVRGGMAEMVKARSLYLLWWPTPTGVQFPLPPPF